MFNVRLSQFNWKGAWAGFIGAETPQLKQLEAENFVLANKLGSLERTAERLFTENDRLLEEVIRLRVESAIPALTGIRKQIQRDGEEEIRRRA